MRFSNSAATLTVSRKLRRKAATIGPAASRREARNRPVTTFWISGASLYWPAEFCFRYPLVSSVDNRRSAEVFDSLIRRAISLNDIGRWTTSRISSDFETARDMYGFFASTVFETPLLFRFAGTRVFDGGMVGGKSPALIIACPRSAGYTFSERSKQPRRNRNGCPPPLSDRLLRD